ncbi:hypothetical protein [Brevibacterium sp. UCMA 11754]|uniref:hypothetical protein n=1 Tax=Brevibacterium sp. UCMA 11754 TaxID=2749198 RepID=UPI001F20C021|nr:hypothetical protein [Brevibacterium sp. UCMA 11754]MCF2571609.1 hypothetical protein [Brevibacterium sp. UCMA 11754]
MGDERYVEDCTDKELLETFVKPTIERIFKPGEIDDARLVRSDRDLIYRITVGGDVFYPIVRPHGNGFSVESVGQQFFDDVQDDVAESYFAWGELRGE